MFCLHGNTVAMSNQTLGVKNCLMSNNRSTPLSTYIVISEGHEESVISMYKESIKCYASVI